MNYFKGKIINWLKSYKKKLPPFFKEIIINNDLLINLHKSYLNNNHWLFIIWCFHNIISLNIYIRDLNNKIFYYFEKGNIFEGVPPEMIKKAIHLRVSLNSFNEIPDEIESLYYKFNL
jgi:hypothetical protein